MMNIFFVFVFFFCSNHSFIAVISIEHLTAESTPSLKCSGRQGGFFLVLAKSFE